MTKRLPISTPELIEEFEWTRCRHGGSISLAACIFGMNPAALKRRFERAKDLGIYVNYHDDSRPVEP